MVLVAVSRTRTQPVGVVTAVRPRLGPRRGTARRGLRGPRGGGPAAHQHRPRSERRADPRAAPARAGPATRSGPPRPPAGRRAVHHRGPPVRSTGGTGRYGTAAAGPRTRP